MAYSANRVYKSKASGALLRGITLQDKVYQRTVKLKGVVVVVVQAIRQLIAQLQK